MRKEGWSLLLAVVVLVAAAGSGRAESGSPLLVRAGAVSAGLGHTCALTSTGGVKCWGYNGHDELGIDDPGNIGSSKPLGVVGLGSGVKAISVGLRHTCALMSTGGVKCWGHDAAGELGDGAVGRHTRPVDVSGLGGGATAVAAGVDHSCALTSAGGVKCWGSNTSDAGALGDGTNVERPMPVDVVGLSSGVTAVSTSFHSCALTSAGTVKCWSGKTSDRWVPVDVPGLSGVIAIATGGGASGPNCALTSSGHVQCWTNADGAIPVEVSGLSGVTAIAAGTAHACALTNAGGVKCWGLNDYGELGDGTAVSRSTPVDVVGLGSGVVAITAGGFQSCAVTRTGAIKCWGAYSTGKGDDTVTASLTPVDIAGFGTAAATLAVASHSVPVTPARLARVKLKCGLAASCNGTFTLAIPGRLTLGRRTFALAARATRAVDVTLSARAFKLLTSAKHLSVRATIAYGQPSGGTTTATRTITLVKK